MTLDPEALPPFLIVIAAVTVGISSFFWTGRNAELKRRWWPTWIIISSALFIVIAWLFGELPAGLLMLIGALVIGWLNVKRVRFCSQCGRMVASVQLFSPPAQYCPVCGASLDA